MTTTSTKQFCMSCVLEHEIDEQTGKCLRCGHQVVKLSTEPKPDRNAGAPPRSPSSAYRAPVVQIGEAAREAEYDRRRDPSQAARAEDLAPSARFDATRSVAAVNGARPSAEAAVAAKPAIAARPVSDGFDSADGRTHSFGDGCQPPHVAGPDATGPAHSPEQGAGPKAGNGTPPPPQPLAAAPAPAPANVVQDSPAPFPSREQGIRPPEGVQPPPSEPAGKPSAAWLAETRALADSFAARAVTADERAADAAAQAVRFKAEAAALRRSAAIYTKLLEAIPVGTEAPPPRVATRRGPGTPLPAGAWSLKHERCIDCGTTELRHAAHGRCLTCDSKWRAGKGGR